MRWERKEEVSDYEGGTNVINNGFRFEFDNSKSSLKEGSAKFTRTETSQRKQTAIPRI